MLDESLIGDEARAIFIHFTHLIHYSRLFMFYKLHVPIAPLIKSEITLCIFNCLFDRSLPIYGIQPNFLPQSV